MKTRFRTWVAALVVALTIGVGVAGPAHADTVGHITSAYTGKCIGIAQSGLAGDWNCTPYGDQVWHWGSSNYAGYHRLVNAYGFCLGVEGSTTVAGASIYASYPCAGSDDQYWLYINGKLQTFRSGMYIGYAGTANGAPLVQWPDDGQLDQAWTLGFTS